MKNLIAALLALFVFAASVEAGSCHGTAKAPVVTEEVDVIVTAPQKAVQEEVDVTVKSIPGTSEVEVDVVESATVIAPPASGLLVRKNARKEKKATIVAAREGRKAARYASKACDAAGQQAREEIVVEAFKQ